ncbi:DMT family transporter [Bacillus songklensis]|uniref:DMT family transporter n=1 Tax=Bacillus songklensis TaxID=1069116 RepID=A0ABV8B675_9BACI
MKNSWLGAFYLSLAASIWGSMYVISKYVLEFIPPLTLVWLRYMIAFFVLGLIWYRKYRHTETIRKHDWLLMLWIGFIGYFVSISLQFIGTKLSNAHTASLITAATPVFLALLAWLLLKEKLTKQKIMSLLMATAGVLCIVGWNGSVSSAFTGNLALVGAAVTWALLSVYVKIASERLHMLTITAFSILFALVFTTPFMIWEIQSASIDISSLSVQLGILYLGIVSTAGAFFFWNKGMEMMDATVGSLFFFFQPLVGTWLGWLLLHETLHQNFFIGALLIVTAVILSTFQFKRKKRNNTLAS